MLRDLQSIANVNVDATKKAKNEVKRGTFVQVTEATKEFVLPTSVDELFIVDRDTTITKSLAVGEPYSEYDSEQDTIKVGEFAGLVSLQNGIRKATTEYNVADADAVADKYLTVGVAGGDAGKLIASATATNIKSLGFIDDNGHKLLAFKIV